MSMRDTYPEPSGYDLAMQELNENVKHLKEQLAEAVRLIRMTSEEPVNPQFSRELLSGLHAFLDQNSEANQ